VTTDDAPECPHGFPAQYVKRCADCRRARRQAEEQAKFRRLMADRAATTLDAASRAAGERGAE
jgi:hypothetical protein